MEDLNAVLDALIFPLAFTCVVLLIAVLLASTAGPKGAAIFAFLIILVSFLIASDWLLLQGLLLLVSAGICGLFRRSKPATALCSVVATLAMLVIVLSYRYAGIKELLDLQHDYPVVSVADRLTYEGRHVAAAPPAERGPNSRVVLASGIEKHLQEAEEQSTRNSRRFMLQALHEGSESQFAAAAGFGVGRMLRVTRERVEMPDEPPTTLPDPPRNDAPYEPSQRERKTPAVAAAQPERIAQPATRDLSSLHKMGVEDFLEPERMGYVRDREHVAGFLPHSIQKKVGPDGDNMLNGAWQVTRLELVSILRFDEPKVYISRELPRMDKLADAPTRTLDAFETSALAKLRTTEDLVIDDGTNRIRMVGSIRAAKDCLACHQVQRGDLLGAFSYQLDPTVPIAPRKPPAQSKAVPAL